MEEIKLLLNEMIHEIVKLSKSIDSYRDEALKVDKRIRQLERSKEHGT